MSKDLVSTVVEALEADKVSDDVAVVVVAALQGDHELSEVIDGEVVDRPVPEPDESPEPAQAFLSAIQVEGFRGIGDKARITLKPGPGLTVISGRNGCGKSSFAEALEVALTTESYRWKNRSGTVWKESWRNVHQNQTASIQVELAVQGRPVTTVGAEWKTDAKLEEVTSWTQLKGDPRVPGLGSLGWGSDLEAFRPFLSYDELSSLLAEPSKLYKALAPILGLEQITDAQKRLSQALARLREPKDAANAKRAELAQSLRETGDERAHRAFDLIHQKRPELDVVAGLITGTAGVDQQGPLATLSALVSLTVPAPEIFGLAAGRHITARAELQQAQGECDASSARRIHLLNFALEHHAEMGDGTCPVCATGHLDGAWAERVKKEIAREKALNEHLSQAGSAAATAAQALRALVTSPPRILSHPNLPDLGTHVATTSAKALDLWKVWGALASADEIATDGAAVLVSLAEALLQVREAAETEMLARQDQWQPLAIQLGAWYTSMLKAQQVGEQVRMVDEAHAWLKKKAKELRTERMRPLSERTQAIWSQLRHESNVDINEVVLQPWGQSGRVLFPASVDGEAAAGLAVMSQGEANALALSVFLPKAMMTDSPFGFLVIDDPVQAMDPAKVDGLARVLAEVAVDRQVVVLTHDDRLPEAVRRLELPARLLQVARDQRSVVHVRDNGDEARRHLLDARSVAKDPGMDDTVVRHVLPTLVRGSLEARCHDLYFTRRLREGAVRIQVEAAWDAAHTTRDRAALALAHIDGGPDAWTQARPHRRRTLTVCGYGNHKGLTGDPLDALKDLEQTLADLERHRGR